MSVRVDEERLLDLVYRTPVEPSLWPQVLEQLSDSVGGAQTWLSELDAESAAGGGVIARIDPAMWQAYADYYYSVNVTAKVDDPQAFLRDWKPRVLTIEDWIDRDLFERSEYYNDFLRPQDIYTGLFVRLATVGSKVATVSIGRSRAADFFDAEALATASRLQPHLIRAYQLGREVGALRYERDDLADVLDGCEAGVVLLDADANILFANRAAARLIRDGRSLASSGRRLVATHAESTRRLQALVRLASDPAVARGGSIGIERADDLRPLQLTVTPARSERVRGVGPTASAIAWVVDLARRDAPDERTLRDVLKLTAAEARVAARLLTGASPDETASALDLSVFTVRAHIRRLFEKTGARRQAELVALLARLARPEA